MYRPQRPRSSSDALSASFNGELLDSQQLCSTYDHLDAAEDSDGDDGPICVPALISPPRSAGEDVDFSPPDTGMASLDFDPMSFQCSAPVSSYAFPLEKPGGGTEVSTSKRSPGSICAKSSSSDLISASFPGSRKLTTSHFYTEKPMQAVSPIKCGKTPFSPPELFSSDVPDMKPAGQAVSPQPSSPVLQASPLLRAAEPSLSEALQMELHSKLTTLDTFVCEELRCDDRVQQEAAASSREHQGRSRTLTAAGGLGGPMELRLSVQYTLC